MRIFRELGAGQSCADEVPESALYKFAVLSGVAQGNQEILFRCCCEGTEGKFTKQAKDGGIGERRGTRIPL